jgi:thiol-disulfide isomerase/thioredoxin
MTSCGRPGPGRFAALLALGLAAPAALGAGGATAPRCPPLAKSSLEGLAKAAGGPLELHFFATWCSDCKAHLAGTLPKNAVLIAWFDDGDRAGRALERLAVDKPCFLDAQGEFAAGLGVREIPAMRIYGGN